MTKKQYYKLMCNMRDNKTFQDYHDNWYKCFTYILKSFKCNFHPNAIKSLFYDFEMENWNALHLGNNAEYKGSTKEQLLDYFAGECNYISDRTSFDRLFRTHYLFIRSFETEMQNIKYPDLD